MRAESVTIDESTEQSDGLDPDAEVVMLEQRMALPESLDELTLDERRRPGPLGPVLAQHVIELVLERAHARRPHRPMLPRTPAVSVTVTARAVDLGAGPLAMEALFEVAARSVSAFCDHGFLVVMRPGDGPTFLYPLPVTSFDTGDSTDELTEPAAIDEVVLLCRQLDEEQARSRAVDIAERFRAGLERAPALRDLLVEVRLGEGTITGASRRVGTLLPAAVWRPV
ncbi:MAG TPA: hypothetical protein VM261_02005 [Kofleriaceae bacterium]|nr:hypothetical protein [Kofleriaceae bacterium]